jgi:putative membrane protein
MTDPTMPVAAPAPPAGKRTERPHPLTPFIRGWAVLLALVIGIGREFVPNGSEPRPLPPIPFILAGVAVLSLAAGVAGFISWRFTRFVIDADELRIDTGAIFRRSARIAFDKVQSIDVVQPFAARLFGLAELQVDVGTHERSKLRYLQLSRAYALRDYLLARARGVRAEVATERRVESVLVDLGAEDEVLVRVSPQTLLLAAVTSHEFWSILFFGVLPGLLGLASGRFWVFLVFIVPTASALAGFVGRRVAGQFNYTLSRRPHGLRISRGLTSLTSQSLPPRRIQAVQLNQSPVWRRLGLYRMDVEVIGWGQVTEDEDKTGVSTILMPAGSLEQVRVALRAIWPHADFEAIPLSQAPVRARWLHPFSQPFLRWGHDDQLVVSRHGWLVRRWQLVPHARVQSVRVAQGPLSRRLGLANLEFHTAGAQIDAHADGLDAGHVLERQAELLALVHSLPARDLSQPEPEAHGAGVPAAPGHPDAALPTGAAQAAGPDALRADHAEETISSTE